MEQHLFYGMFESLKRLPEYKEQAVKMSKMTDTELETIILNKAEPLMLRMLGLELMKDQKKAKFLHKDISKAL